MRPWVTTLGAVALLTGISLYAGAAPVFAEEVPVRELLTRALDGYARALEIEAPTQSASISPAG